jgi:hypothetical protein
MPETGPVEAHNTIVRSKKINKPADREILDHGSVAMEQHDARSGGITPFNVVETYAGALNDFAEWWFLWRNQRYRGREGSTATPL